MTMRVMQYAGAPLLGGLLGVLRLLSERLVQAGHDVHAVLSPEPAIDDLSEAMRAAGITVHRQTVRGKTDLKGFSALRKLVSEVRPEIFHAHLGAPFEAVPALAAAYRGRAGRLVTTEHLPTFAPLQKFYSAAVKRFVSRHLAAVITVSETDAHFVAREFGIPEQLLQVVRNGIDGYQEPADRSACRAALDLPDPCKAVGYVGSLEERKGVDELVEAVRRCGHPDVQLILAGDGPLEESLRARASELPYDLRLTGRIRDVKKFLGALDVFVLPSHSEAMPLALLEAMWSGLPIIATPVGGVPEAVTDGESALMVRPGDPAALSEALQSLLDDDELASRLGAAAVRAP
jgi:glycosyltransferase involved in cell wall biosynthesis